VEETARNLESWPLKVMYEEWKQCEMTREEKLRSADAFRRHCLDFHDTQQTGRPRLHELCPDLSGDECYC